MPPLLTIGEFSRASHLSIKALRHYDEVGLLPPAEVDRANGYRLYAVGQLPTARVIRRFRDLDMPIESIKAVLGAGDAATRDRVLVEHLRALEAKLDETQAAVAALRGLLEGEGGPVAVEYRLVGPTSCLAIREQVGWDDTEPWLNAAFADLHHALGDAGRGAGPDSALYSQEFFEAHEGEVVAFVPTTTPADGAGSGAGRVTPLELPAQRMAVALHEGPFDTIDATYAALGAHVTERAIGASGPVREHYLAMPADPDDSSSCRIEVCWPVLAGPTASPASSTPARS